MSDLSPDAAGTAVPDETTGATAVHDETAAVEHPAPLDLSDARSFVALTRIEDLAHHREKAAGYFRRFDPDEDISLLVYAPEVDPVWATTIVRSVIALAGCDEQHCAHVMLCLVDDGWRTLDRLARRAHAAVSSEEGEWLPIRRPTYAWTALADLRTQAERFWGAGQHRAPYSYDAAIAHLVARGWTTEAHAREGSVPEASLHYLAAMLAEHLPDTAPRLLHVGNFVGVSLSYLLDWARRRELQVVSVDPDVPHRGVERPQRAVNDLLTHFGLTTNHLLVCGYTLEKCFSNDGVVFDGYDPAFAWGQESAPEHVLPGLVRSGVRCAAAFMDGNHDSVYLRRELACVTELLVPGGLLVLDDINEWWEGLQAVYAELVDGDGPLRPIGTDGRVGVLRRV